MVRLGQGIRESIPILQMVPMAAKMVVGIPSLHQHTILWNAMDDTLHGILAHSISVPALLGLSDSPPIWILATAIQDRLKVKLATPESKS